MAPHPGLCALWHYPGSGIASGDGQSAWRRLAQKSRPGNTLRHCLQFVLLCCCGACSFNFGKGARFSFAMAFELAFTNLVFELGIYLVVLLGWQFMVAESHW